MEGDAPELIRPPESGDPSAPDRARAEQEFIATLSHELRVPLSAIMGSLSVIRAGAAGDLPPRLKPLIEMAQRNAERMKALLDDILESERIAAGRLEVELRPGDLNRIAADAVDAARGLAGPRDVKLEFAPASAPVQIAADARRLEQAIANLLSNAIKFSDAGGRVSVEAEAAVNVARLTVADAGPGIPAELHERVFERFWTRDSGDGRNRGGTGLGLGIARALVEAQDGRIDFSSRPGDTRFRIELPLLPAAQSGHRRGDGP